MKLEQALTVMVYMSSCSRSEERVVDMLLPVWVTILVTSGSSEMEMV